jgi:hypothetical protein
MLRSASTLAPRSVLLVALGLLLCLGSGAALGKSERRGSSDRRPAAGELDPREQARQLFQAGVAALQAKDFSTAAQSLSGAYRLAPGPATLFQLGLLAAAQGRTVEAQDLMRRFLNDATEPEQSPAFKEAQRILALPTPPSGEVSVVGERSAVVLIDDRAVGVLPLSLPLLLPIGEHRLVLERDSLRLEDGVTVLAGRTIELRCQFHPGVVVATIPPALLLLTDYPGLSGEPEKQLEQQLGQAAGLARLTLLRQREALLQAPKLADCLPMMRCQLELAMHNLLQSVLLLKAAPRGGSGADWQLKVVLLDATVGDAAVSEEKECRGCTAERAAELLATTAAAALQQGLARRHGVLEVESVPPGAEVTAGGRALGTTPTRRPYFTGPVEVTLKYPGYKTKRATADVQEGQTANVKLELDKEVLPALVAPPPVVSRTVVLPRPRWRLGVGAAAQALGVALGGLGGSALSVDGHCVPDSFVGTQCQRLYTTTGVGSGLIVSGVLLVAGGVTLLALPGKRQQVVVAPPATEKSGAAEVHSQ